MIGTKVRALADRGYVRDLIDVHAAAGHRTNTELEHLGRRHARDEFSLPNLRDRLNGAEWFEDEDFTAYGLDGEQLATLRHWALSWAMDIEARLHSEREPDGEQPEDA